MLEYHRRSQLKMTNRVCVTGALMGCRLGEVTGEMSPDGCGRGARAKGELTPWCTRARASEGCEVRIRSNKKRYINKFSILKI
jgi:hypothetical protein